MQALNELQEILDTEYGRDATDVFQEYMDIQHQGSVNMANYDEVAGILGISKEAYKFILNNYDELYKVVNKG